MHKDDQYNMLVQPNEEIDQSTIQCLELIFGSFIVVSNRMLKDHLKGGKYADPSRELMKEAKSTSTTNAEAERDFGMLDRFKKLKPKALDLTIEGIIMYSRNKTGSWIKNLPDKRFKAVMESARKSKKAQKEKFLDRANKIHQFRVQKLETAMKKKKQKEMEQLQERERLTIQINKYGGLWTNHRDVKQVLDTLNGAEEKRLALKIQLNFRSKVLNTKCDKSLFYMSSGES